MRIDLHTHSTATDGTQTPAELVRAAPPPGSTSSRSPTTTPAEGWAEAAEAAAEVGIALVPGHRDQHRARRARRAPAGLPARTRPTRRCVDGAAAGSWTAATPGCRPSSERLRELGIDIDRRRRAPRGRRRRRDGPPARRRRPGRAGRRGRPGRGVRRATSARAARRTSTGTPADLEDDDRDGRRGRGVSVIAHPWGRHGAPGARRGGLRRAARRGPGRDRGRPPGPRRRDRGRAAGDRPQPGPGGDRRPATTTAPARTTTSWAATPPPRGVRAAARLAAQRPRASGADPRGGGR